MSGPIVRKYGFPNFEKIFGERPLQHGQDEGADAGKSLTPPEATTTTGAEPAKPQADSSKPAKD